MTMQKVYKTETVVSVTEIDAPTPEQALKFVRASEGMPSAPTFTEMERRSARFGLDPEIGKKKDSSESPAA
jgi:hypothetical protein